MSTGYIYNPDLASSSHGFSLILNVIVDDLGQQQFLDDLLLTHWGGQHAIFYDFLSEYFIPMDIQAGPRLFYAAVDKRSFTATDKRTFYA